MVNEHNAIFLFQNHAEIHSLSLHVMWTEIFQGVMTDRCNGTFESVTAGSFTGKTVACIHIQTVSKNAAFIIPSWHLKIAECKYHTFVLVFSVVMACEAKGICQHQEEITTSIFIPEDGGSTFLGNAGICLQVHTALQLARALSVS
jgi:hypothetical protein